MCVRTYVACGGWRPSVRVCLDRPRARGPRAVRTAQHRSVGRSVRPYTCGWWWCWSSERTSWAGPGGPDRAPVTLSGSATTQRLGCPCLVRSIRSTCTALYVRTYYTGNVYVLDTPMYSMYVVHILYSCGLSFVLKYNHIILGK